MNIRPVGSGNSGSRKTELPPTQARFASPISCRGDARACDRPTRPWLSQGEPTDAALAQPRREVPWPTKMPTDSEPNEATSDEPAIWPIESRSWLGTRPTEGRTGKSYGL